MPKRARPLTPLSVTRRRPKRLGPLRRRFAASRSPTSARSRSLRRRLHPPQRPGSGLRLPTTALPATWPAARPAIQAATRAVTRTPIPSALSDFRSTLEPYGTWTDDPSYGTVWVPSPSVVGPDFTPYVSAGHWAYDSDYAWVSDYDWGWAPFHYGRWVYGPGMGWEWIPGRTYAGAWVSWRYGVDDWAYVGWAPLAPTWCWRGGVAVGIGFVPGRRMPSSAPASSSRRRSAVA